MFLHKKRRGDATSCFMNPILKKNDPITLPQSSLNYIGYPLRLPVPFVRYTIINGSQQPEMEPPAPPPTLPPAPPVLIKRSSSLTYHGEVGIAVGCGLAVFMFIMGVLYYYRRELRRTFIPYVRAP